MSGPSAGSARRTPFGRSADGRADRSVVFQKHELLPWLHVIDNVAFPLRVAGMRRADRHAKVRPIIEMVGLAGREEAFPRELSGGQRQRVGIARSLAGDCSVWFLDEPFSALDPLIRRQLQDEFLDIRARLQTTIVFITHDIAEALKLADRIAIMRDGRIVQTNCLWDVLDVIRQSGFWPLAPSLGAEGMWPGPLTSDGIVLSPQDTRESRASIEQTLAMHATLAAYDDAGKAGREGLLTMPQKEFWHPRMMWYGPAGIGTARGLEGFVDHHQLPFRTAFPGRKGGGQWDEIGDLKARLGGGHYIRAGDGKYSVTGGWPSVFAKHTGPDFLGLGPTNRPVTMRVMDFYLHHEGLIRENWVPLDILDLLMQMGVDVMGRMQSHFRRGG